MKLFRDGSAVEIVGLCKSTVKWLHSMFVAGHYPYAMVERLVTGKISNLHCNEKI